MDGSGLPELRIDGFLAALTGQASEEIAVDRDVVFGFASEAGVFSLVPEASVEALSIEWEKLYEANACSPRDSRRWNLSWRAW